MQRGRSVTSALGLHVQCAWLGMVACGEILA